MGPCCYAFLVKTEFWIAETGKRDPRARYTTSLFLSNPRWVLRYHCVRSRGARVIGGWNVCRVLFILLVATHEASSIRPQ